MKIAIILGTRPEIIKMSPIIRACYKLGVDFFILHTGQHFDYAMDGRLFSDLGLPQPRYNLHVGGKEYRKQLSIMVKKGQEILRKEKPDVVLVQGDTTSVLAGALASSKLHIPVAHHESGLRSHDLRMLEEINRIVTDNISEFLFTPTKDAKNNLHQEGVTSKRIFFTGNTIVDAVRQNLPLAKKRHLLLKKLKLKKHQFILCTAHRAENVDVPETLANILKGLDNVATATRLPILLPLHPRTAQNINKFNFKISPLIKIIKPVGYLDFLFMEAQAALIVTDSGGIQEEASILRTPCVTIRNTTERPETIEAGINALAGTNSEDIVNAAIHMLTKKIKKFELYGDGNAGLRIVKILKKHLA